MIKYNSANNVISPFNPIIALNSQMRKSVNDKFIMPILQLFFSDKGGIENFDALDTDKMQTEIEFCKKNELESFVKTHVYKELINEINKQENGEVLYKPKYVITFDWELTKYKMDRNRYPYKKIFSDVSYWEESIRFGSMRLGNEPILYYIYIELQDVLRFIKTLSSEINNANQEVKIQETPEIRRNKLIDELVARQYRISANAVHSEREASEIELKRLVNLSKQQLQGESGKLRVNLSWNTTDDLDLHINTEGGIINYQNKILEYQGVIGKLDVDANSGGNLVSNPQENINWEAMRWFILDGQLNKRFI